MGGFTTGSSKSKDIKGKKGFGMKKRRVKEANGVGEGGSSGMEVIENAGEILESDLSEDGGEGGGDAVDGEEEDNGMVKGKGKRSRGKR